MLLVRIPENTWYCKIAVSSIKPSGVVVRTSTTAGVKQGERASFVGPTTVTGSAAGSVKSIPASLKETE
jgi:hypothetical protein